MKRARPLPCEGWDAALDGLERLRLLWDYEFWAKERLMEHVRQLSPEAYTRDLGTRYGSLHGTLAHLVATQMIWLARWKGTSPTAMAQPSDFPTPRVLEQRWDDVESELRAYLHELSATDLDRPITYRTTTGRTFTDPLGVLMDHVLHHTTFYRGQATALLRILGVNARVETDLIEHWRGKSRQA